MFVSLSVPNFSLFRVVLYVFTCMAWAWSFRYINIPKLSSSWENIWISPAKRQQEMSTLFIFKTVDLSSNSGIANSFHGPFTTSIRSFGNIKQPPTMEWAEPREPWLIKLSARAEKWLGLWVLHNSAVMQDGMPSFYYHFVGAHSHSRGESTFWPKLRSTIIEEKAHVSWCLLRVSNVSMDCVWCAVWPIRLCRRKTRPHAQQPQHKLAWGFVLLHGVYEF